MNIRELDEKGRCVRQLCFVPATDLPTGDVMLAQKIALEVMEAHSVAIANSLCITANGRYTWFEHSAVERLNLGQNASDAGTIFVSPETEPKGEANDDVRRT